MMKRDWTEIVKDKLSDSTATPPDDLWAGISSELDAALPPLAVYSKPKQWRWWAVAAIIATLIMSGVYFLMPTRQEAGLTSVMIADAESHDKNEGNPINNEELPVVTHKASNHLAYTSPTASKKDPQSTTIAQNSAIGLQQAESTNDLTPDNSTNPDDAAIATTVDRPDTITDVPTNTDQRLIAFDNRPMEAIQSKRNKGISVGLYASNTNMPSLRGGDYLMAADPTAPSDPLQGGITDTSTDVPQSSYTLTKAKHRQPLRFGVSMRFPVSPSISLSTGVVYSRLSSSLTWLNSNVMSVTTNQSLNYIGIPASIEYNLPSYKLASFYLTAGAMVEKCVYGESKAKDSPVTKRVTENAFQVSVSAGAGVQLNFNHHISLYVEPLATYYIDNHSDIVNIYKDRKLNLDLRVGLRYTLK